MITVNNTILYLLYKKYFLLLNVGNQTTQEETNEQTLWLQEAAPMNQSEIQSHLLHNNSSKVLLYSASCTVMQSVDFFMCSVI